jgi:nicotinamidase-related amidase
MGGFFYLERGGMESLEALHQTALMVIDVQNYFFQSESPAYLKDSRIILPRINELVQIADERGWPIVFTVHTGPSEPDNLMGKKWRHHPVGEQCDLYPGLTIPRGVYRLSKEYYSAFVRTSLEGTLRSRRVNKVIICGVMTHLCVDTTARHAFLLGLQPVIVADACCSKNHLYHEGSLLALGHGFADILRTTDVGTAPL